jgi:hypothetical protein
MQLTKRRRRGRNGGGGKGQGQRETEGAPGSVQGLAPRYDLPSSTHQCTPPTVEEEASFSEYATLTVLTPSWGVLRHWQSLLLLYLSRVRTRYGVLHLGLLLLVGG